MFERFTDRARRVVVESQHEARALGHDSIGTEHLLLGLISEGHGVGAQALESLGISGEDLRRRVQAMIERGEQSPPSPSGHIPFTPQAKEVLRLSLAEGLHLGHHYIGTEHLLLGLIKEKHGVAARALADSGADLRRVRAEALRLLAAYHAAHSEPEDPDA